MSQSQRPTERWRPTPLLTASLAAHGALLAASILWPQHRRRTLALSLANQGLLAAAGMTPRSSALGRTVVRFKPSLTESNAVALTFDDGPDPQVTPKVLDLLDSHGAKATFFCIGRRVEQHPKLAREIHQRGHTLENHTYGHRHTFAFRPFLSMEREILRGQRAIEETVGRSPTYFRSPAGMRNVFLDPVLHRLGLSLIAWTRRGFDTADGDADRVVPRLARGIRPGDILLLHDGNCAGADQGRPVVLPALERLLNLFDRRGLRAIALPREL